jgi:hypothetical protein
LSVRVCYVQRAERGSMLKALRLVGQTSEDQWPGDSASDGDIDSGAAWIKQRLAGTRDTSSLAMLCLDVEGGVCSWITSPSTTPSVVAALARQGGSAYSESLARPGTSAVEFYAADAFSSSVQPLSAPSANGAGTLLSRPKRTALPDEAHRLAVLAMSDVPARLLVDALDREGVPVDSVASLWHVMAAAWDPSAPRAGDAPRDPLVGETASLTSVILIDPQSARLIWCWSRSGRLLVAGSMRLRQAVADSAALANPGDSAPPAVLFGEEEVSRLATEWLTWAAQVNQAPSRFIGVMPDSALAAEFGRALGKAWPGASVDIVTNDDPVGATLKRTASLLDNSPLHEEPDPRAGLLDLSRRPGSQHRRMYIWWSAAIAAAALALGVLGFQLNSAAASARAAASKWRDQGLAAIGQVFPDALVDRPGVNKYQAFKTEVERLEKKNRGLEGVEPAMPILEELETISLVVGNNGFSIESLDLDSKGTPRFTAIASKTQDAEDLLEALKRVSGSHVGDWTATYAPKKEGELTLIRGNYSGSWIKAKPAGSSGGGSK